MTFDLLTSPQGHQFDPRVKFKLHSVLLVIPVSFKFHMGAQWLSSRVLDSRPKGRGFEPHRRHCVVVLEQDAFILA